MTTNQPTGLTNEQLTLLTQAKTSIINRMISNAEKAATDFTGWQEEHHFLANLIGLLGDITSIDPTCGDFATPPPPTNPNPAHGPETPPFTPTNQGDHS